MFFILLFLLALNGPQFVVLEILQVDFAEIDPLRTKIGLNLLQL
jgi:hypothetical protein